jgi:hypothetical protein
MPATLPYPIPARPTHQAPGRASRPASREQSPGPVASGAGAGPLGGQRASSSLGPIAEEHVAMTLDGDLTSRTADGFQQLQRASSLQAPPPPQRLGGGGVYSGLSFTLAAVAGTDEEQLAIKLVK